MQDYKSFTNLLKKGDIDNINSLQLAALFITPESRDFLTLELLNNNGLTHCWSNVKYKNIKNLINKELFINNYTPCHPAESNYEGLIFEIVSDCFSQKNLVTEKFFINTVHYGHIQTPQTNIYFNDLELNVQKNLVKTLLGLHLERLRNNIYIVGTHQIHFLNTFFENHIKTTRQKVSRQEFEDIFKILNKNEYTSRSRTPKFEIFFSELKKHLILEDEFIQLDDLGLFYTMISRTLSDSVASNYLVSKINSKYQDSILKHLSNKDDNSNAIYWLNCIGNHIKHDLKTKRLFDELSKFYQEETSSQLNQHQEITV